MELDRRRWFVHWFFWSLTIWNEFRGRDEAWRYRNGTNLCHFVRVTFVWCPLVLLLHTAVYAGGVAALTILPIYLYGSVGYAGIIGAIALIIGLILLTKFVGEKVLIWKLKRSNASVIAEEDEDLEPVAEANTPTGPGFFEVIWTYLVSVKQKVCPMITFQHHSREVMQ